MLWKKINQLFIRLLNTGVSDGLPFLEVQKTYLFNLFILLAIPLVPIFFLINIFQGNYGLASLNFGLIILYIIGTWVSITRKYLAFRQTSLPLSTIIFITTAYFYHNGSEYFLIINLVAAVIIFDLTWKYVLFSAFSLCAFAFIKIDQNSFSTLTDALQNRGTINMVVSLIVLTVVLQSFKTLYINYQVKLENSYNEMMRVKKDKERIMQVLVHDLRNPIGAIASFSELLMDDEKDPEKKASLEMIHKTSSESMGFINEIMEMETAENVPLVLGRVDASKIIQKVVRMQQHAINKKHQHLQVKVSEEPVYISADAGKMERVVNNLINNAIKFSHVGGLVEVDLKKERNHLLLKVHDSGVGIPEKFRDGLFTMFGTSRCIGTAGEKSFGLGLAICKQIVEAHRGTISFESIEGKGTTFSVLLPVAV